MISVQQPVRQKLPPGHGASPGRPHTWIPAGQRSPPPGPPVPPLPPMPLLPPLPPVPGKQSSGIVGLPRQISQRSQVFTQLRGWRARLTEARDPSRCRRCNPIRSQCRRSQLLRSGPYPQAPGTCSTQSSHTRWVSTARRRRRRAADWVVERTILAAKLDPRRTHTVHFRLERVAASAPVTVVVACAVAESRNSSQPCTARQFHRRLLRAALHPRSCRRVQGTRDRRYQPDPSSSLSKQSPQSRDASLRTR